MATHEGMPGLQPQLIGVQLEFYFKKGFCARHDSFFLQIRPYHGRGANSERVGAGRALPLMISPDSLSGGDQVFEPFGAFPLVAQTPGQGASRYARSRESASKVESTPAIWKNGSRRARWEILRCHRAFRFEKVGKLGAGGYTVLNGNQPHPTSPERARCDSRQSCG